MLEAVFTLLLDRQGWDNAVARVDALFHWFFEEQEEANLRMAESGEEPIPMTVALAAFESKDTENNRRARRRVDSPAYIRSVVKGSPVRSRRGPATVTGLKEAAGA